MEEQNNKEKKSIDLVEDFQKVLSFLKILWAERSIYYKVCGCAAVAAVIIAFSIPKRYSVEVTLAPELSSESSMGGLSSLASMAGIKLGALGNNDAIGPDLYPTVIRSKDYLVRLFGVPVTFERGDSVLTTTYFDYLNDHQKIAWWSYPMKWLADLKKTILPKKEKKGGNMLAEDGSRSYMFLTEDERALIQGMQNEITCSVDKKTGMITLAASAQDPVVAAVIADSARVALNQFIMEYRTNKARQDYEYMHKVYEQAKADYTRTQSAYAAFADANLNLTTARAQAKLDDLQNEMQLAYGIYSQMANQLQLVRAKIQETTPVYTIIESATVPERATSPRKMFLVVAIVFLAALGTTGWILFKKFLQ
ncbi:MAG: chain-length determining protein [Bacteroidaceae bacterium]|nr:chain-length determining protein [Bacteroidaceae bacterium]